MLRFLCIKGIDSINEKVSILDRFALANADIVSICNCVVQSVRNARRQNAKRSKNNLG
jgi:hypothetical protein